MSIYMAHTDQLALPEAAHRDKRSFELLRVWIADQDQHISLRVGVWKDPSHWGIMLADLAGHIANTFEQAEGLTHVQALKSIQLAFNAELAEPTGEPTGEIE
jgi:Domain of unknown function (DUF5076)